MSSGQVRTPVGICAMCFGKKPLTHGWAWLKLCADCALIQQAPMQPHSNASSNEDASPAPTQTAKQIDPANAPHAPSSTDTSE